EAAVLQVLGTPDRTIAWVGVAGAGKTTTINELLNLIDGRVKVRGFAPDASAANNLKKETGIKTTTIASLLSDYQLQRSLKPGELLIVDEAGKLSADEGYRLMKLSKDHDVRLLLVGDPEQLSSVNAGAPFKAMVENGMSTVYLKDFLRQKDPTLKRAVQMLYHDHAVDSLKLLNSQGCIQEIKSFEDRMQAIATDWLKSDRQNTRIVAGTHGERDAITSILRESLREEGLISKKEYSLRVMPSKDMTQEQMQHARFYEVGDVLVPSLNRAGLKAYKQYHVVGIEGDRITFQQGKIIKTVDFDALEKSISGRIYHPKEMGISTGDRLVWTQNNHSIGRVNGKEATVMGVEGNLVHLRFDDGKRQHVALNQLNHLDHALVRTIYSSQGMTCDRVLVSMGIDQTVCKESILVAMTRARWEAKFYCPSKSTLYDRVEQSTSQVNILEWLKERGFKVKAPPPPQNIELHHWIERIEKSAILPSVAALNVESIKGDEVLRRLLETRLGKKANVMSGKLHTAQVKYWEEKFAGVAEGGAWNSGGIDARSLPSLNPGDRPTLKAWGELKPDNPRLNAEKTLKKGEPVYQKYEAPLDEPKGIFLPEVPPEIAEKIFQRYGVNPTPKERASGFWPCVYWYPQIDIQITEGKKKGEASISQGFCCIPLPSIWGGFRSKDENGALLPRRVLHEELAVFATPGRNVLLAFDKDSSQKTMETVRGAGVVLGELMAEKGCTPKAIPWKTEQGKGIDDFIVAQGGRAWEVQVNKAYPLEWDGEKHYQMQYRKTKAAVERSNGKAPTLEKLDIAIAVSVRPEDAPKIIAHSPALKGLGVDERVQYLDGVMEQAIALAEKVQKMQAQKNTPSHGVNRRKG
ncbi:MAG: AAA family ATPase, partial [Alphaproteobacteria bacterium]